MKWKTRFTVRTLLILILLSAIPCFWVARAKSQYTYEQRLLAHMQEVNPRMSVVWKNKTPKWISSIGIQPKWMDRITRVDATGVTCGNLPFEEFPKSQIDFGDKELKDVAGDLKKLPHLEEIFFQVTQVSDDSIDFLSTLRRLQILNLQETNVTSLGAQSLKEQMGSTDIQHYTAKK